MFHLSRRCRSCTAEPMQFELLDRLPSSAAVMKSWNTVVAVSSLDSDSFLGDRAGIADQMATESCGVNRRPDIRMVIRCSRLAGNRLSGSERSASAGALDVLMTPCMTCCTSRGDFGRYHPFARIG